MNSSSSLALFALAFLKFGGMTGFLPGIFLAVIVEAKYPRVKRLFVYASEMLARLYRVACPPSAENVVSFGKVKVRRAA